MARRPRRMSIRVRTWGIEVVLSLSKKKVDHHNGLTLSASNFSLSGIEPRERNEMCFFGEMR